jgi:hypothetical protein
MRQLPRNLQTCALQLVATSTIKYMTQGGVAMIKKLLIAAILLSTVGCTSFRTTALYRFANDSVVPQKTNKKLKGLPVKLKVPSHVQVTVYEQQVILAPSDTEKNASQAKVAAAKKDVDGQLGLIGTLEAEADIAQSNLTRATAKQTYYESLPNQDKDPVKTLLAKAITEQVKASQALDAATLQLNTQLPELQVELARLQGILTAAVASAQETHTLVSFTPPQYIVERELQYTDKVFLVDFKRPAGGVLDLTEASMDDEQYFAKIKAEITERTLQDIGYALDKVADPLSKLGTKQETNSAIPTSSETPVAETNNNVNFQKSVIATQRFDISEAGWEERLQAFVSEFIAVDNGMMITPAEMPIDSMEMNSGVSG